MLKSVCDLQKVATYLLCNVPLHKKIENFLFFLVRLVRITTQQIASKFCSEFCKSHPSLKAVSDLSKFATYLLHKWRVRKNRNFFIFHANAPVKQLIVQQIE